MVSKSVVSHRSNFFSSLLASAAILLAAAQGCSLITKTDRSQIPPDGGGGEGGGAGATTSTTGGATTGGGGTGGTGGAPCAAECCAPTDCPVPENECVERVCEAGKCDTAAVASGVAVSTQTIGDCQRIVCDGAGATKAIADDADVLDDDKACTIDKCQTGQPKNTPTPAGQACDESGGKKCDGSGACLECLAPSDCASKVCTIAGACAPATCDDTVKNGGETDVDCGGICGATCVTSQACASAADCLNGICAGSPKKCVAPTCMDMVKNGGETDVDCGGAACGPTCGPGEGCSKNGDCKGDVCSGSLCLPSCTDGELNNSEKALDCGGPKCASACDDGAPCDVPSDCTSGHCTDGVCCDTACTTACLACSAAKKTSGDDGVCGPAKQGTDPHGDCDVAAPDTCGDSSGDCDGVGACEKYPAITPCGTPAACVNGVQTNADNCDGQGVCVDNGAQPCSPYACGATACKTSCTVDVDCAANAYCAGIACALKKANGGACAGANQCTSGSCVDGLCCNVACDGICQACAVAAGGTQNGTCTPIPTNQDPAGDCGMTGACDGTGACKKLTGQACAAAAECFSASCVDGFCCNTACAGACQACSTAKKGGGASGQCGPIGVGLDPDDECLGVTSCDGGGACALLATGGACSLNAECASTSCVDGVCCGNACAGLCRACSAAKTGGANGTCADITTGTDPDDECPVAETCAGALTCQP